MPERNALPNVAMARPLIGDEERKAVDDVLRSGVISQGPEVAAFEKEFAAVVDGRECVAVNSGTSALHVALLALGLDPGGEVIVPSFTFAATANAVRLAGLTPVFADIEPLTFCLDPEAVEAVVGPRTVALMPVHLYGQPADLVSLRAIAERHGFALVEDAAQAHSATFADTPVGAWGDAAAFSFYPTKNMTTGEGGLISFRDAASSRQARLLRNQGMEAQYANEIVGYNLRMTDIAAAIGRVQLRRLPDFIAARRRNAEVLTSALQGSALQAPYTAPQATHVFHQFTVRTTDRDRLSGHLGREGIECRVYYPTPVHLLPAFAAKADLPETMRATAEVLSVPVGPHLSDSDLSRVADALSSFDA